MRQLRSRSFPETKAVIQFRMLSSLSSIASSNNKYQYNLPMWHLVSRNISRSLITVHSVQSCPVTYSLVP